VLTYEPGPLVPRDNTHFSHPAVKPQALELTSVGAVIAARSCLPLLVALLEYWCMGRQFPSPKSCAALCCVLLFAGVYVTTDTSLSLDDTAGLAWLTLWFLLLAFQMTYGKLLSDGAELSPHDRVFWTNALSLPFTLSVSLATGELGGGGLRRGNGIVGSSGGVLFTSAASWWLFASCLVGLGISYSGWMLKAAVSATLFTLVGVVNKMATIALSALAFPGTLSPTGGLALTACILAGCLFRDAPMKSGGGVGGEKDATALSSASKKARDSTINLSPHGKQRDDDVEGANSDGGSGAVAPSVGGVHLRGR
jgi:hypothetical protein